MRQRGELSMTRRLAFGVFALAVLVAAGVLPAAQASPANVRLTKPRTMEIMKV